MRKSSKYFIGSLVFISIIILLFIVSCSKNTSNGSYNCNMSSPIMRVANNEKGVFTYSAQEAVFGITVARGVDGNAFYIICDLPAKPPSLNDSVSFSGNIRTSAFQTQIGGQSFYELQPTSIIDLNKK